MAGSVPETVARMEEQIGQIDAKVSRLCLLLEGDGGEHNVGLKISVDRLSQSHKNRNWVIHAVTTGFIGLLAERIWGLIR